MTNIRRRARLAVAAARRAAALLVGWMRRQGPTARPQQPQSFFRRPRTGVAGAEALSRRPGPTAVEVGRRERESGGPVAMSGCSPTNGSRATRSRSATRPTSDRCRPTNASGSARLHQAQQAAATRAKRSPRCSRSAPTPTGKIGEMYFAHGIAEMQIAEDYCNGAAVRPDARRQTQHTPSALVGWTPWRSPLSHFDSAHRLAYGRGCGLGEREERCLDRQGARPARSRTMFPEAAAAVASVPTDVSVPRDILADEPGQRHLGDATRASAGPSGDSFDASGIIKNALPFASAKDPRIPCDEEHAHAVRRFRRRPNLVTRRCLRATTLSPCYGVDARHHRGREQAAAGGHRGDDDDSQCAPGGTADSASSSRPRWRRFQRRRHRPRRSSLFFREKAFWTFSPRPAIRRPSPARPQYKRAADHTCPSGDSSRAGIWHGHGLPCLGNEKTNPEYTGCTDRNA